jgi:hypothetical protein
MSLVPVGLSDSKSAATPAFAVWLTVWALQLISARKQKRAAILVMIGYELVVIVFMFLDGYE